jgi:hypothetical protein
MAGRRSAMDIEALGFPLFLAFTMGFAAWFGVGSYINRQRIGKVANWVRDGVRPFAGRASIRTIGTNAFTISVEDSKAPFRELHVTVLLESREMPFVWLWNRIRGHSDIIYFRADLQKTPYRPLEIYLDSSVLAPDSRRAIADTGISPQRLEGTSLLCGMAGREAHELANRLLSLLAADTAYLERLSVSRTSPHLALGLKLGPYFSGRPHELFQKVVRVATAVTARTGSE